MISIDGLTVEFSGTTLFKDISFTIGDKDRIALMGKNGAGKSTLLKIIAGVRSATRGRVTVGEGGKVGYLPQHLQVEDGRTLVEEASRAFEHLFEIERRIAALNEQLTTRTDYESESYMRLIEEVTAISEKFYAVDLTNYQEDVERILLGLGFERSDFTRQTSEFSGGWRMRIELAKLLLQKPDLLLLDEPTNHLDIESIEWLEDFLMNNAKAVMVISHDKAFVDHITTRTIEIARGRIYDYKVNYSHYLELRRERREQQQAAYDNQQKMIAETREFIERFKGTYSKTNQVQSRVRMLEKLELIEVDEEDRSALNLRFPPAPRSGSYPVITGCSATCRSPSGAATRWLSWGATARASRRWSRPSWGRSTSRARSGSAITSGSVTSRRTKRRGSTSRSPSSRPSTTSPWATSGPVSATFWGPSCSARRPARNS